MSDKTHFSIPLFDVGPEGAGFRVHNDRDELQRKHCEQYQDSDLMYQAELFSVIHGTIKPQGSRGVLIIMDFHFISAPQGRRFKQVDITVAFGRGTMEIGGPEEPVVLQIAPHGTFSLDESVQHEEVNVEAHASAEGGLSLATLGIGGSFQKKTTTDKKNHALLHGLPWIHRRHWGDHNSARWKVTENEKLKNGVPPQLRTAVLISLPDDGTFRAEVTIEARVDTLFAMKRKVRGSTRVDPIYFDPSRNQRKDLGPQLKDVERENFDCVLPLILWFGPGNHGQSESRRLIVGMVQPYDSIGNRRGLSGWLEREHALVLRMQQICNTFLG